ncbi:MAG: endonuclease/exonuclease/phosphatase family protein [Enhygromyxa sp.]
MEALPAEFVLLSWNTHKQRHPRFEAELRRFEVGVDVLLLQEATQVRPVWSLVAEDRAWTLVVAFEYGRGEIATGVATGTLASPVREQALLSPAREPLLGTAKSSLASWIELDGEPQPLLLVNLHGINFRLAGALDAQLRELDELLEAHLGPAVVAGDFNTWSGSRRKILADFADRHKLVSAFDGRPRGRLHDDVYVRGLEVVDAEVLRSRSSDHDALRVELRSARAASVPSR